MILIIKKRDPSNKPQTLGNKPASQPTANPSPSIELKPSPTPFIDKISVVLDQLDSTVPSDQHFKQAHDGYVSLMESQEDKDLFIDVIKNGENGKVSKGGKWGVYNWAKRIVLPDIVDHAKLPLLQCSLDKKNKQLLSVRIEFVPVDLGAKGLEQLHFALATFLFNGWGSFVKHGRMTRIDVAVDFKDVTVGDCHLLSMQGLTTKQWRMNGQLQSYTHGKPGGNHTMIYNRLEKRKAKGKSTKGKEGTRIERRIKSPAVYKLTDLHSLPNPFESMKMISFPLAPPSEQVKMLYIWDLFRCTGEVKGLQAALAMLPEDKRTVYRKYLGAHVQPWWDPKAIWANWPVMLDELKIGSATSWE